MTKPKTRLLLGFLVVLLALVLAILQIDKVIVLAFLGVATILFLSTPRGLELAKIVIVYFKKGNK